MSQPTPSKLIVLDTNVCLDLFVFHDPRWGALLDGLKDGSIKAVTRSDCRMEWLAVLNYPHLPVALDQKDDIIRQFDLHIECIAPTAKSTLRLPFCSDKDDQKFLELARDAGADTLITKDKALLKLARKTRQAGLYTIQTPDKFIAERIA
ncbi:putative toxin-antitoxin system toxin component, PIN family [Undibacterium sp.]|jgi:putative PIN family toxin of toxin-antitoxin system|uniref:putative toxin-antitoxin system toxin component, PIN family n=1 Tax=Undibacterium sp. TaxID=1914977 RepID=UPI002CA33047|nr:putative toxin-antitoxin system toxin component, PIN family [Undibacterium sp.]HTD03111.1 putative toxin-antitoxin system toxin component, PIN family [Undibacterium sp.]